MIVNPRTAFLFLAALLLCAPQASRLYAQGVLTPGVYLGIQMVDIDADRATRLKLPNETGVEVTAIEEQSPAAKAGLRPGDALLSYNGETILGAQQLIRLVRETPPGRHVRLQIWRDRKTQNVTIVPVAAAPVPYANFTTFGPVDRPFAVAEIPRALLVWENPLLGIQCEGVSPQLAEFFGVKSGVLIRAVEKGTSAERAGLRAGDILVSIDDRPVYTPRDLNSFGRAWNGTARNVPVSVVRNRKAMQFQMTLRPAGTPE